MPAACSCMQDTGISSPSRKTDVADSLSGAVRAKRLAIMHSCRSWSCFWPCFKRRAQPKPAEGSQAVPPKRIARSASALKAFSSSADGTFKAISGPNLANGYHFTCSLPLLYIAWSHLLLCIDLCSAYRLRPRRQLQLLCRCRPRSPGPRDASKWTRLSHYENCVMRDDAEPIAEAFCSVCIDPGRGLDGALNHLQVAGSLDSRVRAFDCAHD